MTIFSDKNNMRNKESNQISIPKNVVSLQKINTQVKISIHETV